MKETKAATLSWTLSLCIAEAMAEKVAEDILTLDLRQHTEAVADCFVLCAARNQPHIEAIVTHIEKQVRLRCQQRPWFVEGTRADEWVLLDYVDVVAHVFSAAKRAHYALEDLWADARTVPHTTNSPAHLHIDTKSSIIAHE